MSTLKRRQPTQFRGTVAQENKMFMLCQRRFRAIRAAEAAVRKGEIIDCEANLDIDLW
jgi:hypothetical protein